MCDGVWRQCFSEKCLRSVITFEVGRGYWNALGREMRASNFLLTNFSRLCCRSKHKFAWKPELLDEVDSHVTASILGRSKWLNEVRAFL
ncbi:hypothetical protein RJ641_012709 [Dillenia turbinata]|uniref:Uncharacterized protein n=1 Tax=Dillenia turbinata TaxID=194707 RepID=A0AAN8Z2L8_9MAGN